MLTCLSISVSSWRSPAARRLRERLANLLPFHPPFGQAESTSMWYQRQQRQLKRARQQARAQQRLLFELEIEGIVALTLHTVFRTLTVGVEREMGAQTADALREALRDRRRQLKAEARQLRRAGAENASHRVGTASAGPPNSSA